LNKELSSLISLYDYKMLFQKLLNHLTNKKLMIWAILSDGVDSVSDIPAILNVGVGYKDLEWLKAQLSYTTYFNKGVEWDSKTRDLAVWGSAVKAGTANPSKIRTREIEKWVTNLVLDYSLNFLKNLL